MRFLQKVKIPKKGGVIIV